MDANIMAQLKGSEFFVDEVKDIIKQISNGIPPGFKANHLLGLMGMNSEIGIVMNYLITRSIKEVLDGVKLDAAEHKIVDSPEAEKWWNDFKGTLIGMMTPRAVEETPPPKGVEG